MYQCTLKQIARLSVLFLGFISMSAHAVLQGHFPVTFNMQGASYATDSKWASTIPRLVVTHDVVALQEAGPETALPSNRQATGVQWQWVANGQPYTLVEYTFTIGSSTRGTNRYLYFMRTDFGGNRVNLAMVTADRATDALFVPPQLPANGVPGNTRPTFGLRLPDGAWFFNTHALARNNGVNLVNDANPTIQAIHNLMAANRPADEWAIMGDFNQNPVLTQPLANNLGLNVFRPFAATHMNGGELDYMVARIQQNPVIPWAGNRIGFGSDHAAVEFRLGGAAGRAPDPINYAGNSSETLFLQQYDDQMYCETEDSVGNLSAPVNVDSNFPAGIANTTLATNSFDNPVALIQSWDGFLYQNVSFATCNLSGYGLLDYTVNTTATEPMLAEVTAARDGTGRLNVIAADVGGALYNTTEGSTQGSFSAWSQTALGTFELYHPSLMRGPDQTLQVMAVDGHGLPSRNRLVNGVWSGWTYSPSRPSNLVSMASATTTDALHVFALDVNGVLYYQRQNGATVNAWSTAGTGTNPGYRSAPSLQAISVVTGTNGYLYVFGIDFQGRVWYMLHTGSWGAWTILYSASPVMALSSGQAVNGMRATFVTTDGTPLYAITLPSGAPSISPSSLCSGRCLRSEYFVDPSKPGTNIAVTVNNKTTDQVTISLVDPYGAPMRNVAVSFRIISGRIKLLAPVGKTDANGKYSSGVQTNTTNSEAGTIGAQYDSTGMGTPDQSIVNGSPAQVYAVGG
ncbi:endonuclease/exonuclease/phosphatase family protein [Caldimonas brevitalea]|uniref:endonuclease/exonuclease/phosphatase family protein n=1 Tax=Caldimonas brevitalea TaxID=413882 RepID=UPI0014700F86|nr:endonuclease/exonuclease/phosphatase family protein [Caldimonas brevitalea]